MDFRDFIAPDSSDNQAPTEHSAQVRLAAAQIRSVYLALVDAGFSESEALTLTGVAMTRGASG